MVNGKYRNSAMGAAGRLLPRFFRLSAFACLLLHFMPLAPAQGAVAAADQSSGYSGLVLSRVIQYWQPPEDPVPRTAHVQVRIDAAGRVNSCTPTAPSGNPALDASACAAVKAAGNFATPPYSLPIDVFLHFWNGRPSQAVTPQTEILRHGANIRQPTASPMPPAASAPFPEPTPAPTAQESRYVNQAMEEIRTRILLPGTLTGEHACTVRLLVDAKGKITRSTLDGNGKSEFERAVLSAAQKIGKLPSPPSGKAQELALTFVLEMP
jgi:TonB family protein